MPAPSKGPRVCPDCDAPVAWWRNEAQREERWLLVDLSSDDAGTVAKTVRRDPEHPARRIAWGRKLTGIDLADAIASGEMLFTLHAVTCTARRPPNPKPEGLEISRSARQESRR